MYHSEDSLRDSVLYCVGPRHGTQLRSPDVVAALPAEPHHQPLFIVSVYMKVSVSCVCEHVCVCVCELCECVSVCV